MNHESRVEFNDMLTLKFGCQHGERYRTNQDSNEDVDNYSRVGVALINERGSKVESLDEASMR